MVLPGNIPGKLVKWKVNAGSIVGQGTVLCLYQPENSSSQLKLKANAVGTVKELKATEGQTLQNG